MGYYSDFEIRPQGVDGETLDTIIDLLQEATQYEFCTYGDDGVIHSGDRYKWYDHESDLADLSRDFPDVVFEMRVLGEDAERWQIYAKNGETYSQGLVPVWPEFDESRLT